MTEIFGRLVDLVKEGMGEDIDIEALAAQMGTTGYHARHESGGSTTTGYAPQAVFHGHIM
ncbi:hypothetical protein JT358_06085 [Micrococcales bacterium 31B]|nr:hypothetical protein [Micrococcales bacterium 31B]